LLPVLRTAWLIGLLLWARALGCLRVLSRCGRCALRFGKAVDGRVRERHVNTRFRIEAKQAFHIQCLAAISHLCTSTDEVANFGGECKSASRFSRSNYGLTTGSLRAAREIMPIPTGRDKKSLQAIFKQLKLTFTSK
jgi:hypothetical protein